MSDRTLLQADDAVRVAAVWPLAAPRYSFSGSALVADEHPHRCLACSATGRAGGHQPPGGAGLQALLMRGSHAAGGLDGDRRHGPVGPADGGDATGRPTGQAGLPPGTPGIHPRLCPACQVGTAFGLGRPRAARCGDRRTCHKRLSRAPPLLALTLHKSGFGGFFTCRQKIGVGGAGQDV